MRVPLLYMNSFLGNKCDSNYLYIDLQRTLQAIRKYNFFLKVLIYREYKKVGAKLFLQGIYVLILALIFFLNIYLL